MKNENSSFLLCEKLRGKLRGNFYVIDRSRQFASCTMALSTSPWWISLKRDIRHFYARAINTRQKTDKLSGGMNCLQRA